MSPKRFVLTNYAVGFLAPADDDAAVKQTIQMIEKDGFSLEKNHRKLLALLRSARPESSRVALYEKWVNEQFSTTEEARQSTRGPAPPRINSRRKVKIGSLNQNSLNVNINVTPYAEKCGIKKGDFATVKYVDQGILITFEQTPGSENKEQPEEKEQDVEEEDEEEEQAE